jgi:hypothetical protein
MRPQADGLTRETLAERLGPANCRSKTRTRNGKPGAAATECDPQFPRSGSEASGPWAVAMPPRLRRAVMIYTNARAWLSERRAIEYVPPCVPRRTAKGGTLVVTVGQRNRCSKGPPGPPRPVPEAGRIRLLIRRLCVRVAPRSYVYVLERATTRSTTTRVGALGRISADVVSGACSTPRAPRTASRVTRGRCSHGGWRSSRGTGR